MPLILALGVCQSLSVTSYDTIGPVFRSPRERRQTDRTGGGESGWQCCETGKRNPNGGGSHDPLYLQEKSN